MGTLEILLLGGFQLRRDGSNVDPIPLRAARSLFAYLVLNRDRAHTRDLLAGTFWPDMPDSRARRRLSQALWQIQSNLGDRYLATTAETVRFDPDAAFWLDVDEFQWTIEQASPASVANRNEEADLLTAAVDLYKGDLLAGFYDDWMIPDQERLRERFLGAMERLCDLAMARGDYEATLIRARRLAQHDPLREEAHRTVMRVAVLLGRHNEAIRQYEQCRRILTEEFGTEPAAETRAIYEATIADRERGGTAVAPGPHSPLFEASRSVPIIGRDRERATLVRRLDEAIDGEGTVVLLEGEAGVGKTRLLAEVVDDARWRGMDVLWGRATPSEGRPFGALAEALEGGMSTLRARQLSDRLPPVWRDPLIPLLPALAESAPATTSSPLRPADEQARMREAMALAVQGLAALSPLLLVIDDLHWADEDSVQALGHLAPRIEGHPVVLVISYRHAEARERSDVWGLLRAIDRTAHCERLSLPPCTPAQTEELVRRSIGLREVNAEFSERLHRQTGGIPLLILETLRALHERDQLEEAHTGPASDDRVPAGLPLTDEVHGLILSRLGGLPAESAATLHLIAVDDGGLRVPEIVEATDTDERSTLAALDDLVRRRLVDERAGRFVVGHEVMRRVVYDDLGLSERLELHRRVALAIERHRPDLVEPLAHHFSAAHMPDRAAGYLDRAADRALAVHAYEMAAHHLEAELAALDAIEGSPARRYLVAEKLEQVLDTLARREEQGAAIAIMEAAAAEDQRADVHRRRAWWLAHMDRFAEATTEARTSLKLARDQGSGEGRIVAALSTQGMIACFAGRAAEGVVHLEEAASLAGVAPSEEADARNALGQNLIDLQRFEEAEVHLVAALALYGDLDDKRGQAEVVGMLGMLSMERGEPDAAETHFRRAIEISTAIGYRHGEAVHRMNLGILQALRGSVVTGIATFDAAAAVYADMGNRRGQALVMSNTAWLRHSFLGRDDQASAEATRSLEYYEEIGDDRGRAQCMGTLASIAWREKRMAEARSLFSESLAAADSAQDSWLAVQILKEWAAAEAREGDLDVALSHADRASEMCRNLGIKDLGVAVEALRGRILLRSEKREAALAATTSAMASYKPGIESGHLVPFSHSLALRAGGETQQADLYLDMAFEALRASLEGLSEEALELAMTAVPFHRDISVLWRSRQPRVIDRTIASVAAPSGRALRDEELVSVRWTVAKPGDEAITEGVDRRRHRLARITAEAAAQGGAPTVEDLAEALGSSVATIRRDLAALRAAGATVPTRGHRVG